MGETAPAHVDSHMVDGAAHTGSEEDQVAGAYARRWHGRTDGALESAGSGNPGEAEFVQHGKYESRAVHPPLACSAMAIGNADIGIDD